MLQLSWPTGRGYTEEQKAAFFGKLPPPFRTNWPLGMGVPESWRPAFARWQGSSQQQPQMRPTQPVQPLIQRMIRPGQQNNRLNRQVPNYRFPWLQSPLYYGEQNLYGRQ